MALELNCVVPDNGNIVSAISNFVITNKRKCMAINFECNVHV